MHYTYMHIYVNIQGRIHDFLMGESRGAKDLEISCPRLSYSGGGADGGQGDRFSDDLIIFYIQPMIGHF